MYASEGQKRVIKESEKKNISKFIDANEIKECEIWMANLPDTNTSVQRGIRPVFVWSNNTNNKFSTTINVFSFTTKVNKKQLPVHVQFKAGEYGLISDSTLIVEHAITLSKDMFIRKIGKIDDKEKLLEIVKAWQIQAPILQLI